MFPYISIIIFEMLSILVIQRKVENGECHDNKFPLPTQLGAGYSVKLI